MIRQRFSPYMALLLMTEVLLLAAGCRRSETEVPVDTAGSQPQAVEKLANDVRLEVAEVSLGHIPNGLSTDDIAHSPDQRRVAFKVRKNGKWAVIVDGDEKQPYDEVSEPEFSPNSLRVAYAATRDNAQFIVVDDVEQKAYDPSEHMYPVFSPDSKRIAYIARRGDNDIMVIDGIEGKPYRSLGAYNLGLVFSPDSKRYVYPAQIAEQQWTVDVDGVEGMPYDCVEYIPQFSPDSQRVAYHVRRQGTSLVVVDGVEGPAFDFVTSVQFSPDSRRLAYIAKTKAGKFVVVNGMPGKQYDDIERFTFSPDSQYTVFVAGKFGSQCVVLDDKEQGRYKFIECFPEFSPDHKHLVYVGWTGKRRHVVLDAAKIGEYTGVTRPIFSPDSQRLAYAAKVEEFLAWAVICDGKEGPKHRLGEVFRTEVAFSPDSRRMAYRASQGRSIEFMVVDGAQSENYQCIEPTVPVFSPNSKHVAYWAFPLALKSGSSSGWRLVVDGSGITGYGAPLLNTELRFDGPDTLYSLVVRDNEIHRVEIKILPN